MGKQDEFTVEVKRLLLQDQNNKRQANVSKEELKALKELKLDNNRLILTANKGVALVVIDKQEYIKKAEDLLQESSYKKIADDPTAKQKNKLISILRRSRQMEVWKMTYTEDFTQQVLYHQNFMGCQKSINLAFHSGP